MPTEPCARGAVEEDLEVALSPTRAPSLQRHDDSSGASTPHAPCGDTCRVGLFPRRTVLCRSSSNLRSKRWIRTLSSLPYVLLRLLLGTACRSLICTP